MAPGPATSALMRGTMRLYGVLRYQVDHEVHTRRTKTKSFYGSSPPWKFRPSPTPWEGKGRKRLEVVCDVMTSQRTMTGVHLFQAVALWPSRVWPRARDCSVLQFRASDCTASTLHRISFVHVGAQVQCPCGCICPVHKVFLRVCPQPDIITLAAYNCRVITNNEKKKSGH